MTFRRKADVLASIKHNDGGRLPDGGLSDLARMNLCFDAVALAEIVEAERAVPASFSVRNETTVSIHGDKTYTWETWVLVDGRAPDGGPLYQRVPYGTGPARSLEAMRGLKTTTEITEGPLVRLGR